MGNLYSTLQFTSSFGSLYFGRVEHVNSVNLSISNLISLEKLDDSSLQIVRLLANHPHFGITLMTADRKAGQSIGSVFPHLVTQV